MALKASLAAYLVGSFFASVAYQLFPFFLIAYTSALRIIVQKDQKVSSWASKSHLTTPTAEETVWQ